LLGDCDNAFDTEKGFSHSKFECLQDSNWPSEDTANTEKETEVEKAAREGFHSSTDREVL